LKKQNLLTLPIENIRIEDFGLYFKKLMEGKTIGKIIVRMNQVK
jgi:hypothetical protein